MTNQFKLFLFLLLGCFTSSVHASYDSSSQSGNEERKIWVNTLVKICDPVLTNLANETLNAYSGGYPFSISGDIRSVPS